jgi:DNA-binding HxlR family transcriptional regulator
METTRVECDTPNAYLRDCESRQVLDLLANRWCALVMGRLVDGPQRFGALRRSVDGISQKVLTQNLRQLERDGLVTRTVYPTTPPSVSYALTDLGRDVAGHLVALRTWSERHMPQIKAARQSYDARTALPTP